MMNTPRLRKQGYTTANKVEFVRGGKEYFDKLKELVDNAKQFIHLQVYIFSNDETGLSVAESLIDAAKRGVTVYFLFDGYASEKPNEELAKRFQEAGVNFAPFEPLFRGKTYYFGRRMHQKVLVVDGVYSLVGGVNVADRYNDVHDIPAWLDFAACIYGEASIRLNALCCEMWNKYVVECKAEAIKMAEEDFSDIPASERCSVRVRQNDWVRRKYEIWRSYFDMFNHASDNIMIMCSYFLPGIVYRKRIEQALKRGVKIKVIITGKSDVMVAKYAERYLYNWMLRNKMEVYEYTGEMLHAKIAMRDGNWMTIGSYNVNNISAFASIEMNVDIRNKNAVSIMQKQVEEILQNDTIRITEESLSSSHNLFMIFLYRCSYEFIRAMLYIFTFYFRQEE